jgi:hypothetical protein
MMRDGVGASEDGEKEQSEVRVKGRALGYVPKLGRMCG